MFMNYEMRDTKREKAAKGRTSNPFNNPTSTYPNAYTEACLY